MRRISVGLLLTLSCAGPDPDQDGFLLVDPEARAAGVSVQIQGEERDSTLPVAVPAGDLAQVHRPGGDDEPIAVSPGEMVEIVGPEGEIRRGPVSRDRLVVGGTPEGAALIAELVGGRASPDGNGHFLVEGPDALLAAALLGPIPGITGSFGAHLQHVPPAFMGPVLERGPSALAYAADDQTTTACQGPTPDAAALVGAYVHGSVTMILDAAGGYTITTGDQTLRGTYAGRPGGVAFVPNGAGTATVMCLQGEDLVDDLGVEYAP